MLAAVLIVLAAVAASVATLDRLLAVVTVRRAARRIGASGNARSVPVVRIAGTPFLTQLISGRYRDVTVTLTAFTVGGADFSGLTARLTQVRAPLRALLAGGGLVAGQMTATATIPLSALSSRLPQGLRLRQKGGELRVSGSVLRMPVSGVLRIRVADPQRISVIPKVLGVPSLVGFVIGLPAMPPQLVIKSVRVTGDGLEVSLRGDNVTLAPGRDQASRLAGCLATGESGAR